MTLAPAPVPDPILKGNAVQDTLGRFASASQKSPAVQQSGGPGRQALDVAAFTKLLLTGERGPSSSRDLAMQSVQANHGQPVSESSSSADTASISQHSIFETVPQAPEESPRSSFEVDSNEAKEQRPNSQIITESKKKPPPPKSRRGKPLRDSMGEQESKQNFDNFINSLSLPSSRSISSEMPSLRSPTTTEQSPTIDKPGSVDIPETSQRKVPPAPPLARKKSQQAPSKPMLTRSSSSRYSVLSDYDVPLSPSTGSYGFKIPPPPPAARRTTNSSERRPSFDVQSVAENAATDGGPGSLDPQRAEAGPGLSQTPSYLKRMSQGPPPPVPPPRRGRGSSRSSVETQRPSMAALESSETEGGETTPRSEHADRRDLLADLAALQKEVDAARRSAG
ncbi:uncharacterized protein A1O9_11457 [Exophiala aquamarina CBS 119918]|uniref:Uncharacterized protein n=1 Tax=Exophiala aquamarina CBS 119918 TaxID=1182545 RepID=A0A072NXK2_9EURO|nr:uncharacterized protein A1O9_11457 [Exophiala aquamarina CBS 119918]KEF52614.1 hypothetical protein A1O9_11457 [Exophiala aquamarina CBS 119918]